MIVLYSTTQEAKLNIVAFLRSQTQEPIAIAQTDDEILDLARLHRPKKVFLFMPLRAAVAVDIQNYLRELLPYLRIRILPSVYGTEQLLEGWQKVVSKALRPRAVTKKKKKEEGA